MHTSPSHLTSSVFSSLLSYTCSGCLQEEIAVTSGRLFQWYSHKQPWYLWRNGTEGRLGHPPWDPQRKRNDEEAVAEAVQSHRKARTGFATAPDISNPALQVRKGNPGVSTNSQMWCRQCLFFSQTPTGRAGRGWLHRTCPPLAERAPGPPGIPTTSSLRSRNESWKYNKTQFQCKPLFNFPFCTIEPATYKVLV